MINFSCSWPKLAVKIAKTPRGPDKRVKELLEKLAKELRSTDDYVNEQIEEVSKCYLDLVDITRTITMEMDGRSYTLSEENVLNTVIEASNDNLFTIVEYCKQRNEGFKNDIQWIGKMLGFELSDQIPPELPPKKTNTDALTNEIEKLKLELDEQKNINHELELTKCNIELQLENAFLERKLVKDQYDDQSRSMTTLKYKLQQGRCCLAFIILTLQKRHVKHNTK